MTHEHQDFLDRAGKKANDETHRKKLLKVIGTYDSAVGAQKSNQFLDWQAARALARQIKSYAIANLPELLQQFESVMRSHGAEVLWAEDVAEAQRLVMEIVKRHQVKNVVKSKSMISEEMHLNHLLESHGVSVLESDLGELIVQLAGEKPYHIVTPAMHKSKAEIAQLFHDKLGTPNVEDAEMLTMAARDHLRSAYLYADLGVSGANFLIAQEGAIVITENEGNARLSTACPPIHLAIAGIEKVLPSLADLELFLPLLATSGTGQQITAYNSIIRGPRKIGEVDGPEKMYVILLDNGRSQIYADQALRESLRCIRCGACLNACPVYKAVGGHTYNTAYPGPIGAVIIPHLSGIQHWNHLAYASSLCGACNEVCPVDIPIPHLLLLNRQKTREAGSVSLFWRIAIAAWAFVVVHPRFLALTRPLLSFATRIARAALPKRFSARMPQVAARSFREIWRDAQTQQSKESH